MPRIKSEFYRKSVCNEEKGQNLIEKCWLISDHIAFDELQALNMCVYIYICRRTALQKESL